MLSVMSAYLQTPSHSCGSQPCVQQTACTHQRHQLTAAYAPCRDDNNGGYQDGLIEQFDTDHNCYIVAGSTERFAVQFHQFTVEEDGQQLVLKVFNCTRVQLPAIYSPVVLTEEFSSSTLSSRRQSTAPASRRQSGGEAQQQPPFTAGEHSFSTASSRRYPTNFASSHTPRSSGKCCELRSSCSSSSYGCGMLAEHPTGSSTSHQPCKHTACSPCAPYQQHTHPPA